MKSTKNVVPLSRDIYNKIICLFQKDEFVDIQKYCEQNEVLNDYVYSELKYFLIIIRNVLALFVIRNKIF